MAAPADDMHQPAYQFNPEETAACLRLIELALEEDLGRTGDITSNTLVPAGLIGTARFLAKQAGVLAGVDAARLVFHQIDPGVTWHNRSTDGALIQPGDVVAEVTGAMRSLLTAERTALNFLQRLCGIATRTRQYVTAIAGHSCAIYDTRKTTPGQRLLEKYAVRVGGGVNHRLGLHDAVLIKDNHVIAWRIQHCSPKKVGAEQASGSEPSLADAVRNARTAVPVGTVVEIEVDTIEQLKQVLPAEPDIVLLDNFSLEQLRAAVAIRDAYERRILLEASGGINLDTVPRVAASGVDRISVGALTHSAPSLDISLDFEEPRA